MQERIFRKFFWGPNFSGIRPNFSGVAIYFQEFDQLPGSSYLLTHSEVTFRGLFGGEFISAAKFLETAQFFLGGASTFYVSEGFFCEDSGQIFSTFTPKKYFFIDRFICIWPYR